MCKSRLSGGGEGGGDGGEGEEGGGEGGGGGGQNLFVIMQSVRRLARSRVKTKWCVVLLRRPHPALQHLRPGLRAARYQCATLPRTLSKSSFLHNSRVPDYEVQAHRGGKESSSAEVTTGRISLVNKKHFQALHVLK